MRVRRTALAIEAFHKASLVHDDIEDDDTFRYGRETLHRQYGVGTAINVGDYLIGLGYRLVSRERKELGGDCTADILNRLSDAHLKLSEGQGAELLWRDAADKSADRPGRPEDLRPEDGAGVRGGAVRRRAAGRAGREVREDGRRFQQEPRRRLPDSQRPQGLGRRRRQQAGRRPGRARRPADAAAGPGPGRLDAGRARGIAGAAGSASRSGRGAAVRGRARPRGIFEQAQVFDKAEKLVEKFRARAEAIADEVEPTELRELLYYLVDTVLDRQSPPGAGAGRSFNCSSWSRHERFPLRYASRRTVRRAVRPVSARRRPARL